MAHGLWNWSEKLRATMNTYGVVGCFDVDYIARGSFAATKVKYVHWNEACGWAGAFLQCVLRLRKKYTDTSILDFLEEVLELFMSKAVELAMGPINLRLARHCLASFSARQRYGSRQMHSSLNPVPALFVRPLRGVIGAHGALSSNAETFRSRIRH